MATLTSGKEMRRSIELGGTPFSLYYFKPPSFKNMNEDAVLEMKLIVRVLANIYSEATKYDFFSDISIGFVKEEISKLLALSQRCGYRVLMLNAPFNTLGVFVFGKKFSIINSFFGGKSDGFYSIAFTKIQKLAKEAEKELLEERKDETTDYTDR